MLLSIVFQRSTCIQGLLETGACTCPYSLRALPSELSRKKAQRNEVDEQAMGKYSEVCFLLSLFQDGKYYARGRGALALSRKLETYSCIKACLRSQK